MKRLQKFFLSFMISVAVFSMPANAEFSSYDSNNLSYIRSDVSTISNYVRYIFDIYSNTSSIYSTLQNVYISIQGIDGLLDNYIPGISSNISLMYAELHTLANIFSSGVSGWDQYYSDFNSLNSTVSNSDNTLSDIYSLLEDRLESGVKPDYSQMYLAFDTSYFSSTKTQDYYPFMVYGEGGFCNFMYTARPVVYTFEVGSYALCVNLSIDGGSGYVNFNFNDYKRYYFNDCQDVKEYSGITRYIFYFDITEPFSFNDCYIYCPGNSFYSSMYLYKLDDAEDTALNPDQESTVSDVDDAGHQQSQQEDQMWQNINTYKGDISFNLDGWDDAAGGLSYVTAVFMTIWNNSPTQPIVLSLMLGIAMLSIGRGVMAAVRVSRNRGDD